MEMKLLRGIAIVLFLMFGFFAIGSESRKVNSLKDPRKVKHERMAPAGGRIGFVKTKYF